MAHHDSKISHADIYRTLEDRGILLISKEPIEGGKIIPVELLISEMLADSEEIREIETIPALLAASSIKTGTFIKYALGKEAGKKAGYMFDKIIGLQGSNPRNQWFDSMARGLEITINGIETPLVEGYAAGLGKEKKDRSPLEIKWGIFDPIEDSDYLVHMNEIYK